LTEVVQRAEALISTTFSLSSDHEKILKAPYPDGGYYLDVPRCRKSMFTVQFFS